MILDTCALLWLAAGDPRLNDSTRKLIADSPSVGVSAISAFEIAQKSRKGHLVLPDPPSEWFRTITDHHQIDRLNLTAELCLCATELPEIHKDPFDRLIIATALQLDRPVVTADTNFAKYGVGVLS